MGHIGKPVSSPRRQYVGAEQGAVPVVRARLEAGLGGQPTFGPLGDGDAATLWSSPRSRHERRRRLVQPALRVDLSREAPLVLSPAGVAIASPIAERSVIDPNAAYGAIHPDLRREKRCRSMQQASDTPTTASLAPDGGPDRLRLSRDVAGRLIE